MSELFKFRTNFSASHFYHSDELSTEENQNTFGLCSNQNGHGHDYAAVFVFQASLEDREQVEKKLKDWVFNTYEHKSLNHEVKAFKGVPTTELLAKHFFEESTRLGVDTKQVALFESDFVGAVYPADF